MKKIWIIIAIVFLWGVGLRAVEVLNGNYLFGFDIGRDLLVARDIVENHKLTLIGAEIGSGSAGINGIFQGPGYYYLLAIVYWLFHGDPYGALLLMFLFGVATLGAIYWTGKRIFDQPTAIIALFLTGISPFIVSQSRFVWAPHPASLFIVLFLYFGYMIPKRPRLYAPLTVLAAGLTYHFEFAMTVPMVLATLIALPVVFRIKDVKTYFYSFAWLLTVFSPSILFEMRHGWRTLQSIISYNTPQEVIGGDIWLLRIQDHMDPYITNVKQTFPIEYGLLPDSAYVLLACALILALVSLAWKTKDKTHRMFFQLLLITIAVTYGVLLLLNNKIWDYYLIHAHFIFIYVFAYTFIFAFRTIRKFLLSKIVFIILTIFFLSMTVASAWRMMISYKYDYHDVGGVEKIQGKKIAIDYVYNDAEGKPFSEFTFMAPIYTYPYDYLFQTYGQQKYGYVPGNQKKGLVYLIIEPDANKPWTYKGWLETVIVGGDIIKTVTLPTGQIVQVRQFP